MKKIHAMFVVLFACLCSNTFAADFTACKAAVALNRASWYVPSYIAKEPKIGVDEEVRVLEFPMCVNLDAVGGWRVVAIAAGQKLIFPKPGKSGVNHNIPVRHALCNNLIDGAGYAGSLPGTIAAPHAQQITPAQAMTDTCDSDDCGNTTKTQIITQVVKQVKVCESANGKRFPAVNGECTFEPVVAHVSTQVEATATCTNCGPQPQSRTQPQAKAEGCGNCVPTMQAKVLKEEDTSHTSKICGIAVMKGDRIVGRLQLDEDPANPGKIRIAKVDTFSGAAIKVAVSPWRHTTDCNQDQSVIYNNWPKVVEKFNLPNDCTPAKV